MLTCTVALTHHAPLLQGGASLISKEYLTDVAGIMAVEVRFPIPTLKQRAPANKAPHSHQLPVSENHMNKVLAFRRTMLEQFVPNSSRTDRSFCCRTPLPQSKKSQR